MSSAKKKKLLQQINSDSEESANSLDQYEQNIQQNGIERKKGETLFQFLQRRTKFQLQQNIKQKKKEIKPEVTNLAINQSTNSSQIAQAWKSSVQSPVDQLHLQNEQQQILNQTFDVLCKTPNISSFKTPMNVKTTIFESMSKSAGKHKFPLNKQDLPAKEHFLKNEVATEKSDKKKVSFSSTVQKFNVNIPTVLVKKFDLISNMIVGYDHFVQNLLSRIQETLSNCTQLGKFVENYPEFFDTHQCIKEKINELKVSSAFLNQSSKQSMTLSEILNTLNEFQNLYENEKQQYIQEVNQKALQKVKEEKETLLQRISHLEEEIQQLKYSQKLQQSDKKQDLLDKLATLEKENQKLKNANKELDNEKKAVVKDSKSEIERLMNQIKSLQQKQENKEYNSLIKEIQDRYESRIIQMEAIIKDYETQIKVKQEQSASKKKKVHNENVLEEQINQLNHTMNLKENMRIQQKEEWEELYHKSKEENRFLKGENNALKLENEKLLKKISEFNSEKRQLDAYIKQNDLLLQRLQEKHDECDNLLNILKQVKDKAKEIGLDKHLKAIFKKLTPSRHNSKNKVIQ